MNFFANPTFKLAIAWCFATTAGVSLAADIKKAPLTLPELIKASTAADWRGLNPESTLYLELEKGRVVIELAPELAPQNVANIKALVREAYFDGLAIIRSQDNYVVQWGDADEKREIKTAQKKVPGEFTVAYDKKQSFTRLPDADGYAPQVGHVNGFPVGRDPKAGKAWIAHCYATVGVARGNETDSGNGSSLYVISGHAPRHLDRNITAVGRVVAGMDLLSVMPRGKGMLGFYEKPEERSLIKSVRLAADVPEAERSKLEIIRTDSAIFQRMIEAQRNRGGDWYKVPANYIELCNVALPVREQK